MGFRGLGFGGLGFQVKGSSLQVQGSWSLLVTGRGLDGIKQLVGAGRLGAAMGLGVLGCRDSAGGSEANSNLCDSWVCDS